MTVYIKFEIWLTH